MKKAIQFGAGNIGRGFIGYLLNKSGYNLVFADVFDNVVNKMNEDKGYTIHIMDVELEDIKVDGIRAVNSVTGNIVVELEDADIVTTAVGPLNLVKIAPSIAKAIAKRSEDNSEQYLNIIACENAIYASSALKDYVYGYLDEAQRAYADKYVGFPNCSVDRIVPPSQNENPLDVTVEKFFEWNVEKDGFKGGIPEVEGMNLADNLLAYIERKLFTLNTGHAITAYLGSIYGLRTIDEAIEDERVSSVVTAAMKESGDSLIHKFGFDKEAHYKYIDKILNRFKNPYLKDDVKRVGREPIRKLSPGERFVKPLETALSYNLPVDNLVKGIGALLHFKAEDPQSIELQERIQNAGLMQTVKEVSQIRDSLILENIEKAYHSYE